MPMELADQENLKERVRQTMDDLASKPRQKHINLTDVDVRLIKNRRGPVPSFNAQAVVSPLSGGGETAGVLITTADVCADLDDHAQLIPMMEQAEMMTGTKVPSTLADGGYHSGKKCAARGRRVLMPDSKKKLLGGAYHKDRFIYGEASDGYICPQG